MNLYGYGTKSLGLGIAFLSMTIFCGLDRGTRSVPMVIVGCMNASIYACSDSLLLTPLCCDDIHDVTPRVSALAGCESNMPQDQEENPSNDDEELKEKTPQQGQNQSWLMTLASSAKKPSKTFDKWISTPIDFSAFIMNDLKINNLTVTTHSGKEAETS
ncbi:hypothetical protein Tco_0339680 [Tanacetum coccineum]